MEFQSKIKEDSKLIRSLKGRATKIKEELESPVMVLEGAAKFFGHGSALQYVTNHQLEEYKNLLIVELNDYEKALDILLENHYESGEEVLSESESKDQS